MFFFNLQDKQSNYTTESLPSTHSSITKTTVTMVTASVTMDHSSEVAAKFHILYDATVEVLETFQREKLNEGELRQKDVKGDLQDNAKVWYEPRHEKTCLCPMRTTKAQISLRM